MGTNWGVSVSYLGNHSDRLWDLVPLNPAVFMGLGPARSQRRLHPVCSTTANTNDRRVISLENPRSVARLATGGLRRLRRLELSRSPVLGASRVGERRELQRQLHMVAFASAIGWPMATINSRRDRPSPTTCLRSRQLHAEQDAHRQSHRGISDAAVCRHAASGRRLRLASVGIVTASSGPWLTVFTGRDSALNGQVGTINQMTGQRANQISDDVYGPKTLTQY